MTFHSYNYTSFSTFNSHTIPNLFLQNTNGKLQGESKFQSEGYTRELSPLEHKRFDEILDRTVEVIPLNSKNSIKFKNRELLDFLIKNLYEKGLIQEPVCEIGGGSTRHVLDETWEYCDVDVSFHLKYPNDPIIMQIVVDFIIQKLPKTSFHNVEDLHFRHWVQEQYIYNTDKITKGMKFVERFIGLGERGIDLKFIADETARWNVASYDSFYISYPGCKVRSMDAGEFCSKDRFESNFQNLQERNWIAKKPSEISNLLFCIVHARSQGVAIPLEDQKMALDQFTKKYTLQNPIALTNLTKKFHRQLKNHSCNDERKIFTFINFLSLFQSLESKEEQRFYTHILATAWKEKDCPATHLLPTFATLIQTAPEISKDILNLLYGLAFYGFLKKGNEDPLVFNALSLVSFNKSYKSFWQLCATHNGKTSFLALPQKPPEELARSFLSSWTFLEKYEERFITNVFKEFGFHKLAFSDMCKSKLIRELMDAFDQPPLTNLLAESFPQSNPTAFYASVMHAMPNLVDETYLEKKFLLATLWKGLIESKKSINNEELARIFASYRRTIRNKNGVIELNDLKLIIQFLESKSVFAFSQTEKKALRAIVLYLIHQIEKVPCLILLESGFKLIALSEIHLNTSEDSQRYASILLKGCLKIKGIQDPIALMRLLHILKSNEKITENEFQHLSQLLLNNAKKPGTYLTYHRFNEMAEACFKTLTSSPQNSLCQNASMTLFDTLLKYALENDHASLWQSIGKLTLKLPSGLLPFNLDHCCSLNELKELFFNGMINAFFIKDSSHKQKNYDIFLQLFESTLKSTSEPLKKLQKVINIDKDNPSKLVKLFIQAVVEIDYLIARNLLKKFRVSIINPIDELELNSGISSMPIFQAISQLNQAILNNNNKQIGELVSHVISYIAQPLSDQIIELHFKKLENKILEALTHLIPYSFLEAERLFDAIKESKFLQPNQRNAAAFSFLHYYALNLITFKDSLNLSHIIQKYLQGFFNHTILASTSKEISFLTIHRLLEGISNDQELTATILSHSIENKLSDNFIEDHCLNLIKNGFKENNPKLHTNLQKLANLLIERLQRGFSFSGDCNYLFLEILLHAEQFSLFIQAWNHYPFQSILSDDQLLMIFRMLCEAGNRELSELAFKIFYKDSRKYEDLSLPLIKSYMNREDENEFSRIRAIMDIIIKSDILNPLVKLELHQALFPYVLRLRKQEISHLKSKTSKMKKDKISTVHEINNKYINYLKEQWKRSQIYLSEPSLEEQKRSFSRLYIKTLLDIDLNESFVEICEVFTKEPIHPGIDLALLLLENFADLPMNPSHIEQWKVILPLMLKSFEKAQGGFEKFGVRLVRLQDQPGNEIPKALSEADLRILASQTPNFSHAQSEFMAEFTRILNWLIERNKGKEFHYIDIIQVTDLISSFLEAKRVNTKLEAFPTDLLVHVSKELLDSYHIVEFEKFNTILCNSLSQSEFEKFSNETEKKVIGPIKDTLQKHYESVNCLADTTISKLERENLFKRTKELLPKYKYHDSTLGRQLVKKLIYHSLLDSSKWVSSADDLLLFAQDQELFAIGKMEDFSEWDEKQTKELEDEDLWKLSRIIVQNACQEQLSHIALSRLNEIIYYTQWDLKTAKEYYHLALEVHEAILLNIIKNYSLEKHERRNEYYIFLAEFIKEVLYRPIPVSHREFLNQFITQVIYRVLYYPKIFRSIESENISKNRKKNSLDDTIINSYNHDDPFIYSYNHMVNSILSLMGADPDIPFTQAHVLLKKLDSDAKINGINENTNALLYSLPFVLIGEWIESPSFCNAVNDTKISKSLYNIIFTIHDDAFHSLIDITNTHRYRTLILSITKSLLRVVWQSDSTQNFLIPFIKQALTRPLLCLLLPQNILNIKKMQNEKIKTLINELQTQLKSSTEKTSCMNFILSQENGLKVFEGHIDDLPINMIFETLLSSDLTSLQNLIHPNEMIKKEILELTIDTLECFTNIGFLDQSAAIQCFKEIKPLYNITKDYVRKILPKKFDKNYITKLDKTDLTPAKSPL